MPLYAGEAKLFTNALALSNILKGKQTMKKILTIIVMLFAPLFVLSQTNDNKPKQPNREEQAVLQVEREIFDAFIKGDAKTLERLFADDMTSVSTDGFVITKPDFLRNIKPVIGVTFDLSKIKARVYGDAAIVTGIYEVKFKQNNKDRSEYFQITDTIVKRKSTWQLASSHNTEIPVWRARNLEDTELNAITAIGCDQESSLKSLTFDVPTYVRFTNSTNQPVTRYWINYEGKRDPSADQKYTLKPGQTDYQVTYLTHPFLITDASGKCLGIYQPMREAGLVVIK